MWKVATLEIPADGRYLFELPPTGDAFVSFARCNAACDGGFARTLYSGDTETFELAQGRYYATFWRWVDDPGTIELRIAPER